MDDNGDAQNGGTGSIIPNPSTVPTASQTPVQPDIPAWSFAGSNSVPAPVFGQPSERQSTTHKRTSMPSSVLVSTDSQSPFANLSASIAASNANSQAKVSQASPPPLSSAPAALDTLNDDQALTFLLKNKTVAGLFQDAFNTRVEEHQRKLERAYNQRLLELEEYTRRWRDSTKELWLAVSEGKFDLKKSQQENLNWKGPQEAGRGFHPESPTMPQEIVEKEFDSDGKVACISVKNSTTSNPKSHFNLLNWTNSNGCGSKDFKTFAHLIAPFIKKPPPRLVFRHKTKLGTIKYRSITYVESTIHKVNKTDVVIELTPSNVALLGKAFCYLKDTNDRIFQQVNACTDIQKSVSAAEQSFLYNRFSPEPMKGLINVLPLYNGNQRVISDLFAVNINVSAIPKKLLIARPRYDGSVSGAEFFDVASGAYTTRQENDEDIILFEDKTTFNKLALLLCFSINTGIVPVSLGATTHVLSPSGTSSEAQVPSHPSAAQGSPSQEWITDIKGSATDFVSPSSQFSLLMKSPYLEDDGLSKFLKTPPSCGRILFRLSNSVGNYTYLAWKGFKLENSPELKHEDIVVEFTHQNMFLLWKAFCLLWDRSSYLFSKIAGPLSEASRKAFDDMNDKLDQRYRGSLSPKKQRRSLRGVLLPYKASPGGGIYDNQADGTPFNRKVVIARPYHHGKRVIAAEFFDAGSGFRKNRVSAEEIVITEETATLQDLGHLLEQGSSCMHHAGEPKQSLFQRTLDLSNGLKELENDIKSRRDESNPEAHSQWLAVGGEAQDVCSPSPRRERDTIEDNRPQAHRMTEEVLLSAPTDQNTHDNTSNDSENSDLIMLDERPENVTFRCSRKRPLPAVGQKAQRAKRPKL